VGLAVVLAWIIHQWYPVQCEGRRLAQSISGTEAQVEELRWENRMLCVRSDALDTSRGMELELRSLGWIREDERPVRSIPARARSAVGSEPTGDRLSVAERMAAAVAGAVKGVVDGSPRTVDDRRLTGTKL